MSKRGAVLAGRIMAELNEVSTLVERIETGMRKAKSQSDDFFLDSVALNLHGFYSGVERIFEKIAAAIDESVPDGANWHSPQVLRIRQNLLVSRTPVRRQDIRVLQQSQPLRRPGLPAR